MAQRRNGGEDMADALHRAEAYRAAGADVLLLSPRNAEEARHIGEHLEPPLMYLCPPGGLAHIGLTPPEMAALGFKLLIDTSTPLLAAYAAMKSVYTNLANDFRDDSRTSDDWSALQQDLHDTIGLDKLLTIEKATVEK